MKPENLKKLVISYRERAMSYCQSVQDDDGAACLNIRLAAKKFIDELESDGDFRYVFDDVAAFKACTFIESMPHTKGVWAAQGKKLKLSDWQIWITCAIFGWKDRETGHRRIRRALILVPRKNGKSAWAAAIGNYMLCADGEYGAEIYSGATSLKQAMEVFSPARVMAQKTPKLCDKFSLQIQQKSIISTLTGSKFEPVIGKPGDGASPSCAIIDEYHEHETDILVETMRRGKGRVQTRFC